jgi:hypothetical protein
MRGSRVKKFFRDQHFFFSVSRGSRKRSSALMARQASLLGRAERSTPGARRSRRKARGVDGESACRATMVSGHYAANVTAFFLIPSFSVDPTQRRSRHNRLVFETAHRPSACDCLIYVHDDRLPTAGHPFRSNACGRLVRPNPASGQYSQGPGTHRLSGVRADPFQPIVAARSQASIRPP